MTTDDILKAIEKEKDHLRAYGVSRVGLFGSQARGETTSVSDIDLLFEFVPEKKTYRNFYNATTLLEGVLGHEVDAVTPQALSSYIKPHIEKDIRYVQIIS